MAFGFGKKGIIVMKEKKFKNFEIFIPTRQEESIMQRLEYCRAFLFVHGLLPDPWNDALKRKLRKKPKNRKK